MLLETLQLADLNLPQWPFSRSSRVPILSLERCLYVESALTSFIYKSSTGICLRKLNLTLTYEKMSLAALLETFSPNAALECLRLLTVGIDESPIPVVSVIPFRNSLRHLVLEHRSYYGVCSSVKPHTSEDFLDIVRECVYL